MVANTETDAVVRGSALGAGCHARPSGTVVSASIRSTPSGTLVRQPRAPRMMERILSV